MLSEATSSEAEDRQLLIHFLWSGDPVGEDKEKGRIDAFSGPLALVNRLINLEKSRIFYWCDVEKVGAVEKILKNHLGAKAGAIKVRSIGEIIQNFKALPLVTHDDSNTFQFLINYFESKKKFNYCKELLAPILLYLEGGYFFDTSISSSLNIDLIHLEPHNTALFAKPSGSQHLDVWAYYSPQQRHPLFQQLSSLFITIFCHTFQEFLYTEELMKQFLGDNLPPDFNLTLRDRLMRQQYNSIHAIVAPVDIVDSCNKGKHEYISAYHELKINDKFIGIVKHARGEWKKINFEGYISARYEITNETDCPISLVMMKEHAHVDFRIRSEEPTRGNKLFFQSRLDKPEQTGLWLMGFFSQSRDFNPKSILRRNAKKITSFMDFLCHAQFSPDFFSTHILPILLSYLEAVENKHETFAVLSEIFSNLDGDSCTLFYQKNLCSIHEELIYLDFMTLKMLLTSIAKVPDIKLRESFLKHSNYENLINTHHQLINDVYQLNDFFETIIQVLHCKPEENKKEWIDFCIPLIIANLESGKNVTDLPRNLDKFFEAVSSAYRNHVKEALYSPIKEMFKKHINNHLNFISYFTKTNFLDLVSKIFKEEHLAPNGYIDITALHDLYKIKLEEQYSCLFNVFINCSLLPLRSEKDFDLFTKLYTSIDVHQKPIFLKRNLLQLLDFKEDEQLYYNEDQQPYSVDDFYNFINSTLQFEHLTLVKEVLGQEASVSKMLNDIIKKRICQYLKSEKSIENTVDIERFKVQFASLIEESELERIVADIIVKKKSPAHDDSSDFSTIMPLSFVS